MHFFSIEATAPAPLPSGLLRSLIVANDTIQWIQRIARNRSAAPVSVSRCLYRAGRVVSAAAAAGTGVVGASGPRTPHARTHVFAADASPVQSFIFQFTHHPFLFLSLPLTSNHAHTTRSQRTRTHTTRVRRATGRPRRDQWAGGAETTNHDPHNDAATTPPTLPTADAAAPAPCPATQLPSESQSSVRRSDA